MFRLLLILNLLLSFYIQAAIKKTENLSMESMVKDSIKKTLAKKMHLSPDLFEVEISNFNLLGMGVDVSKMGKIKNVEVLDLEQATARRFSGLCMLPVLINSEKGSFDSKVQMVLSVIGPTYVAKSGLSSDSTIKESDLTLSRMAWKQMSAGTMAQPLEDLLGKRTRQMINAGQPVFALLLENPFDVRPGEFVDLTIHSGPGVMIRSRVQAQESGRVGEIISLVQPETKKKIRATITGQRMVEVRL